MAVSSIVCASISCRLRRCRGVQAQRHACMHHHTCSEMDIWSSGPRMATLPAMVAGSVSKMTLHGHMLSQQDAIFRQPLAPPTAGVGLVRLN